MNRSAGDIITRFDAPEVFMYFDPPYPEGDCGRYEQHKGIYYELLELLPDLKCNWLMSSYPSEQLSVLRKKYGWNFQDIEQALAVDGRRKEKKVKTECLTWNYNKGNEQLEMF